MEKSKNNLLLENEFVNISLLNEGVVHVYIDAILSTSWCNSLANLKGRDSCIFLCMGLFYFMGKEFGMGFLIEIFLIGVGLSMDAFAVSICKGLTMKKVKKKDVFVIALFFGGFQALMPFIGWVLGRGFESYITSIDHWIAFILLGIIGGKMLLDGIKGDDEEEGNAEFKLNVKELFMLAIATSIDALAVGITFAFLNYPIVECISLIGCTTFVISFIGIYIGHVFGSKYEHKAEIAGGIILIIIGLKILLEHLGILL